MALKADSSGDWKTMLRIVHPEALVEFRAYKVFQVRMLGEWPWPGMEGMGPALDSVQRDRITRHQARERQRLLDSVFQVASADALARLAPDSVYARWVRGSRDPVRQGPDFAGSQVQQEVVGAVRANDSVAYVVLERRHRDLPRPDSGPFASLPRSTKTAVVLEVRRWRKEWRTMLEGLGVHDFAYGHDLEHEPQ
jgi:hypothetical protein